MDLARLVGEISVEIGRQVGLLIERTGYVTHLIVGNDHSIEIPHLDRYRVAHSRLRGLRLFHTHLKEHPLNQEDLMDLVLNRFDSITAACVGSDGIPKFFFLPLSIQIPMQRNLGSFLPNNTQAS